MNVTAHEVKFTKAEARRIEEILDNLIQVIDHDPESIDDTTTEDARELLMMLESAR